MQSVKAGQLRKRVRIQALSPTPLNPPNPANEPDLINSWSDLATVWASIEPLSGRELAWAETLTADVTHKVTIRYYPGITPKMRFLYLDPRTNLQRLFNIELVRDLEERHRRLECICHESG